MGLPVISTVKNGACEIMADGVHGSVLADPDDTEALAAAMRKWLDPGVRLAGSEQCLLLRPALSVENHLARLESLYREALSR